METGFELRWFYAGTPPKSLETWFDRKAKDWHSTARALASELPEPRRSSPRNELHLLARGREDLSLKVREGRVELGFRLKDGDKIASESADFSGLLEPWARWRWRYGDKDPEIAAVDAAFLASSRDRICVTKARTTLKYEIESSEELRPIPPGPTELPSATLELAVLKVADKLDWWSVEIELATQKINVSLVKQLLAGYGAEPRLSSDHSYSYPRWLSNMYKVLGAKEQTTSYRVRGT